MFFFFFTIKAPTFHFSFLSIHSLIFNINNSNNYSLFPFLHFSFIILFFSFFPLSFFLLFNALLREEKNHSSSFPTRVWVSVVLPFKKDGENQLCQKWWIENATWFSFPSNWWRTCSFVFEAEGVLSPFTCCNHPWSCSLQVWPLGFTRYLAFLFLVFVHYSFFVGS